MKIHVKHLAAAALASVLSSTVDAQVIYVDVDATGANDGTTWANAYNDLQDALASASNTQVWVAEGVYTPDASNKSASFSLVSGVELYGGFGGDETALDERNLTDHETILSGDLAGNDPTVSDNAFVVVRTTGVDDTAVLDGFTVRDAFSRGLFGGGSARIHRCTFTDNGTFTLNLTGGGASVSGSPEFVDCTFVGNIAKAGGGGMRIGSPSTINVVNCEFFGNVVDDGFGGGLLVNTGFGDNAWITNCVFHGNETTFGFGGGIFCDTSSTVSIDCTTIAHNHANDGGGITPGSDTRIRNSIVWGNTSTTGSAQSTQIDGTGVASVIDYTCIEDFNGTYGTGNTGADPVFLDRDGEDDTVGTADDDLRLWFGSGVIDVGNDAVLPLDRVDLDGDGVLAEDLPFDADLTLRVFDGDGDGTAELDMGAYEFRGCQQNIGFAGPGTIRIEVCGDALTTSGSADLSLVGGEPGQQVYLVYGLTAVKAPLAAGTATLVPDPAVIVPLTLDANGELGFAIPGIPLTMGGMPFDVFAQFVGLQPGFKELSNAVVLVFGS